MRLEYLSSNPIEQRKVKEFANWILNIGDGNLKEANDVEVEINIPSDLLITDFSNLIEAIIHSTYQLLNNSSCMKNTICDSTILSPKLSFVDEINSYMLSQIDGEAKEYLSLDSVCKTSKNRSYQVDLLTLEVLNALNCSDLLNHRINLKVRVSIMLIRNIDQSFGLCN